MAMKRKPKIGLLGMMIEGYEPIFPGITKVQENYAKELVKTMSPYADVDFPGVADNRAKIEESVEAFNRNGCDGILIVLLAYSHSSWIVRAMQNNKLPLALAILQPDDVMTSEFTEYDFTRNQGIHGAQDNANILMRLNIPCQYFVGSRHSVDFSEFFSNFSKAAMVYTGFRSAKVAVIGKMTGMGDLFTDDIKIYEKLGMEHGYASIGSIYSLMQAVPEEDITKEIEAEKDVFDLDPAMPVEAYRYAQRQYLAIKRFLTDGGYDAFTLHFETLGEDGRFTSLPFLAASKLLADGYGYAAEGDALCACGVLASSLIAGEASFSEMYALDYQAESILMCHAGEGNYKMARRDRKPRLVYKVFNEGGLANPPTTLFAHEPGRATVVSFAPCNDGFKILAATGEITEKCDLNGCEMPYLFFKPDTKQEDLVKEWLSFGATHHEAVMYGDQSKVFEMLASMWKCEFKKL